MQIDKATAESILLEEGTNANGSFDKKWEARLRNFSEICESTSRTHVAFLAAALLAKSYSTRADVYSVKARKGKGAGPGSYSVRGVVSVWTKLSRTLGVNLGVTGREPLNNQPYFGIDRLTRHVPVKQGTELALQALCDILDDIQELESEYEVKRILRAFIHVRREYNPVYSLLGRVGAVTAQSIAPLIEAFVSESSEGGKRAQAVAAALLDALAGDERVVTARINDPDRGFPGDVAIRATAATGGFKAVFEVRDKVVSTSDIEHFAAKVSARRISSACILAVSSGQPALDPKKLAEIAEAHVVFLQMIIGWKDAVNQVLLWAERSPDLSAQIVAERVYVRAQELEVSPEGVGHWTAAIAGK